MPNKKDALTDVAQSLQNLQPVNNPQVSQPAQPVQQLKPFQVVNDAGQVIQLHNNNASTK